MKIKLSDLRNMIREERQRMVETMGKMKDVETEAGKTKEVDADEYGHDSTLETHVDHTVAELKQLNIKERRAIRYIKKLREQRAKARARLRK